MSPSPDLAGPHGALRTLLDDDPHPVRPADLERLADGALGRAHRRAVGHRIAAAAAAAAAAVVLLLGVTQLVTPARHRVPPTTVPATRLNVALIGIDAAPDRVGARPDTMMVASVDTTTGATTLVGVPRDLEMTFPAGPAGRQYLNSWWTIAEQNPALFPGDPHPGLTATLHGMQLATGLHLDEYIVVDLRGLAGLIDAVGGVTVDVRDWLPIGSSAARPVPSAWIRPGRQHLDGYHALWYARSRMGTSDRDRMDRQQCLVTAIGQQVDLPALATRWPAIVRALGASLQTSIAVADLPRWADLALRARRQPVQRVVQDRPGRSSAPAPAPEPGC